MNASISTAILVAGMHRSGTSALTGALNVLGISLGDHLLAPGGDNPKGYWEHQGAVEIHERLLTALGRRWDDVRPLPDAWLASDAARTALAEIDDLISREFVAASVWAVKDPRICRFLPLWIRALQARGIRPVVLFAARKPSEVSASIAARNHWSAPVSEMLWLRHVFEAETASRSMPRTAVIYDDLLADPAATVATALARLDVVISRPTGGVQDALAKFVDSADRHHAHPVAEGASSALTRIADAAYASLTGIAHGEDGWHQLRECAARFEAQWQHCGPGIEAVAEMAHRFSVNEVAARTEASRLASDLNAQIRWSEEAMEIRTALQASHDELTIRAQQLALDRNELAVELHRVTGEVTRIESELSIAKAESARVGSELSVAKAESARLAQELSNSQAEASAHAATIEEMLQSRSWKVTRPMRELARLLSPKARPR